MRRALLLVALATLALAGSAQARQVQQYFYAGEAFEAGGSDPAAIALDSVNHKILVVGNGDSEHGLKISKFQLNGDPAGFSGRGEATSFNTGEEFKNPPTVAIAVDESTTASAGNFYVTANQGNGNGASEIYGYSAAGTPLAGFPVSVAGACGLTVAPDGNLWVASEALGVYGEVTPSGHPTGEILPVGGQAGTCRIAIDSAGNFYVAQRSLGEIRFAKYDPERHFLGLLNRADPNSIGEVLPKLAIDRGDGTLFGLYSAEFTAGRIVQIDPSGNPITTFGDPDPAHFSYAGLSSSAKDLAVDPQTHKVYVLTKEGEVNVFSRDPSAVTVPTLSVNGVEGLTGASVTLTGTVDPDGIDTTDCHFEWGEANEFGGFDFYDESVPCSEGAVFTGASGENAVTAAITGLTKGTKYHFRLSSKNANGVVAVSSDGEFRAADAPLLSQERATHITTDAARIGFSVNTNGEDTRYHVEIGTDTGYGTSFPVPDAKAASAFLKAPGFETLIVRLTPQPKTQEVKGLQPETEYHYRIVAENVAGRTEGADHVFRTFALPTSGEDKCPNAQARQQTSAAGLMDCRAYELVSAPETGGYDVRSGLSPEVSALATSPQADDAALYSMRSGTIPGIAGHPTNRGADPYLARRGSNGWSTRYVGLASNNPFAEGPFASPLSGSDSALSTFGFGGAEICDPCFEDGSTNVPLRLPDGSLVQGMVGSIDPSGPANPAGTVRKPLSPDGSHFLFATTAQFEPGANSNGTDATVYSRDLGAKTTEVISTDESGTAIANGQGIAELDVAADGSRTVIGEKLASDSAGNDYYHLYLHIAGIADSVDLMPGATQGALYDGMSADGSKVFFTSSEPLAEGETDTSADVYEDEVAGPGAVTPRLISNGSGGTGDTDLCSPPGDPNSWNAVSGAGKCSVLAFAGGAGVASAAGDFYFLSPELLDGPSNGTQDQANLYVVRPGATSPSFVATIDSSLVKPPPAPGAHPTLNTSFGGSHSGPEALAVDQSSGDVYVAEPGSGRVSRYTETGESDEFTEGPGAGTNSITGLSMFTESTSEVAIDNSGGPFDGDIYVTNVSNVRVFSHNGASLGTLTGSGNFGEVCGVAVDQSDGSVYVGDYAGHVWRFTPTSPGALPIDDSEYTMTGIGTTEPCEVAADDGNVYELKYPSGPVRQFSAAAFESPPPNVEGTLLAPRGLGLSVDPVTHEVYVDVGNRITVFNAAGTEQLAFGTGELFTSRGVAANATSHHVYASTGPSVIEFGYESTPYAPIDNPAIVHAIKQAGTHDFSDFEVSPDGRYAAFGSVLPLDGFQSGGHYEVFRYDTESAGGPVCASCSSTLATPSNDATLTPYGLSLSDDGRIFFTTAEQLTLRDTNEKRDAYEWENGKQELISTGTSPNNSELLSVSADGTDAFFFTRQKLVPEDNNGGNVRLYDAREGGGFAFGPPSFQCAASDECHGASTQAAPALAAGTTAGTPGQFSEEKQVKCRKGKVWRHGKCVGRHPHKRHGHKRAAKTTRGGGK